jgi:pimeloyl-ACP methyl ester carboxylesterase
MTVIGCTFSKLEGDLEQLDAIAHVFDGTLAAEDLLSESVVIVAMHDADGAGVSSFDLMYGSGPFEMRLNPKPTWFFAFNDLNKDLAFQADEPYAWAADGQPVEPDGEPPIIMLTQTSSGELPAQLVNKALIQNFNDRLSFAIGTVSSLDNPLFSEEQSSKGLWQPFAFMADGGAGIHFMEPYDASRTPVLFVHGILGSPRNFETLIENLDTAKYQAWVYTYPSGLRLDLLADGMAEFLEILHRQLRFDEMHVVAHSMGGLVSRGGLNRCQQAGACSYLRTYTTISTPWSGVQSAQSGVTWAPTVVPVWRDLDPTSDYLATLFETPLPSGVPHHLLFGFRQDKSIFGSESSDGVIKLSSQLRQEAQTQASLVHGYDENHVSILSNELVLKQVYSILDSDK